MENTSITFVCRQAWGGISLTNNCCDNAQCSGVWKFHWQEVLAENRKQSEQLITGKPWCFIRVMFFFYHSNRKLTKIEQLWNLKSQWKQRFFAGNVLVDWLLFLLWSMGLCLDWTYYINWSIFRRDCSLQKC